MAADEISYEEHVQQNNQRLVSIRHSLREPHGYASGCQELLTWCSDARAFNQAFEANLLEALESVVEESSREGRDVALAQALIQACHQHRKLLSKTNSQRINRWYEQFRKKKANAAKKSRAKKATTAEGDGLPQTPVDALLSVDANSGAPMWGAMGLGPDGSPLHSPFLAMPSQPQPAPFGMSPSTLSPYPVDPSGARPFPGYEQMPHMMYPTTYHSPDYLRGPPFLVHTPPLQPPAQQRPRARMRASPGRGVLMPDSPSPANLPRNGAAMPRPPPAQMRYPQPGIEAFPPQAHIIRAGPPMLFGQMQTMGAQQVLSFPNPNVSPPQAFEIRMTTPKEIILRPFHLEHNAQTSTLAFQLSEEQFASLKDPSMDVQLKCYHKEDGKQSNQWPSRADAPAQVSVAVSVNGQCVPISAAFRALYLKELCRPGLNQLQITVHQCVCSHAFVMQLVSRQPFGASLDEIFSRNRATANPDASKERMSKLVQAMQKEAAHSFASGIRLPLFCGRTRRRMTIPARSFKCQHVYCFDLQPFLAYHQDNSHFECPVCKAVFNVSEIEICHFTAAVLRETASRVCCEVLVDERGNWRPVDATDWQQCEGERKRQASHDVSSDASAAAASVHPLKRMKSEPFVPQPPSASPFAPLSVPSGSFVGSPITSPYSSSPSKMLRGDTPHTPSTLPPSSSEHRTLSPPHAVVAPPPSSSVETVSVAGSAPYTPASVGSGATSVGLDNQQCLSAGNGSEAELEGITPSLHADIVDFARYLNVEGEHFKQINDFEGLRLVSSLSLCPLSAQGDEATAELWNNAAQLISRC